MMLSGLSSTELTLNKVAGEGPAELPSSSSLLKSPVETALQILLLERTVLY